MEALIHARHILAVSEKIPGENQQEIEYIDRFVKACSHKRARTVGAWKIIETLNDIRNNNL